MLKGVYTANKKDGTLYFRSSITYRKKHISLGSYESEIEANKAYLEAEKILYSPKITIQEYESLSLLDFEKWVILINFRDNNIYFGTPIYAWTKFFYYYLSPNTILKFDVDDLFYYSSHKIMKRDGHLFVADYGMQVNILSRYGIRSFAVPGKDYIFLNGDNTDFRHSNIKLVNQYQGVSEVIVKGKIKYKSKINIPGYFVIGYYHSETEAAIAYNKAIDILKRNGFKKKYTPNYIENLPASQYAEIYTQLKISEKILNLQKN
ncbi:MAG: hypothetical protein IIX45_03645 [Lachnospiraceae bacterium]|nr:hypothetical protein [Lachnospiraceae bacterium]MEE0919556.1 hypothetical protein [Lachnospiraceae bacterium]